jgi:hypothetical protein
LFYISHEHSLGNVFWKFEIFGKISNFVLAQNFGAKKVFILNFFIYISHEHFLGNVFWKFEIFSGKILNLFWRKFEIFRAKLINLNNYLMNFFKILYTFYFENISFFIFLNNIYISHEQFLGNVSCKTCLPDLQDLPPLTRISHDDFLTIGLTHADTHFPRHSSEMSSQ